METTERRPVADIDYSGVVVTHGPRTLYRELRGFDPEHPTAGPLWYGEEVEDGEIIEACYFKTRRDGKVWVNTTVVRSTVVDEQTGLGLVCVYDAEGVRVHENDRIESSLLLVTMKDQTRRFGTVVDVTADWISVRWDDAPNGSAPCVVTVDVVENFCRVVIEDATPDGDEDPDERELVPDFYEACENVRECGGF